MANDLADFVRALYLVQGSYPFPTVAADFPDWTDGVYQVTGTIPAGADFPDWTKAIGVVGTPGAVGQAGNFSANHHDTPGLNVTVPAPANVAAGDLLVGVYVCGIASNTLGAPAGWTVVYNQSISPFCVLVAYKIAGTSEPASYTFTDTVGSDQAAVIGCYTGVSVIDTPVVVAGGSGTTGTTGSATPSLYGEVEVAVFVAGVGSSFTTPAGFTNEVSDLLGNAKIVLFDRIYQSQAATGGISTTLGASVSWVSVNAFLR